MPVQTYLPAEILDYVETHAPGEDSAFGISQRELARALGYHPCSMSRPLQELVVGGLLKTHRGIVRGGLRKQFVYSLTESGRLKLRTQTKDIPLLSGALPPPPNPFLGRKEELRDLASHSLEGAALVFVEGPPGIGKTALVSRHVRRFKVGRIPFWFTVRSGSSPHQFTVALAHALTNLGAQQLAYYSQLSRQPAGREVADLVSRALNERSLAAVIDDIQNATPDMRKFLSEFIVSLMKARNDLIFVVGQDPPFFQPQGVSTHQIVLGGLDRAAAHELTDRRGGLADRFEAVYQASMGSPLLLQLAVNTPGVEATVAALPAAVVGRLPPAEISALFPIALANEPLPPSFVAEAGILTGERINELIKAGILQRTLEGRVELLQVVRGAILSGASPADERIGHLKLAGFYGRSHRPESVRERFLHLVAAEAWKPAGQIVTVQERTLLSLGYSDGLRTALRHLTLAMPRGPAKLQALRVEAALLRLHSEYSEAILCLRRAIAESLGDPKAEAESLLRIVELYVRLRQLDDAERTLSEARSRGPFGRRLEVFLMLSEARVVEAHGDLPAAHTLYQSAFKAAKRHRASDLALESVAAWSRLAFLVGDQEAAFRAVEQGLPEARQSGRMDIVFNLLLGRARAYIEIGQKDRAEAEMRMIRAEAEALGYLSQLTYTLSGLAAIAIESQRWIEAVSYAKQAIAFAERLGNDLVLGHTLALLCTSEFRQGFLEKRDDLVADALAHGKRSIETLSRLEPSDSLVLPHVYLVEIYLHQKVDERARWHYAEALRLADSMKLGWLRDKIVADLGEKTLAIAST